MLRVGCSSPRVEDNAPYLRWSLSVEAGRSVPGRHSRNQGGRACCPQRAANVNRHSYKPRAEDRHALPPNGKIFEKWRDSRPYVSSAPGAPRLVWTGLSDAAALVVPRGAL